MTNQELAEAFKALFEELHEKVEAMPDGPEKTRAKRLLDVFHRSGDLFAEHAIDLGEIQPMLGGTDKPI